jgi:hypothetical protein
VWTSDPDDCGRGVVSFGARFQKLPLRVWGIMPSDLDAQERMVDVVNGKHRPRIMRSVLWICGLSAMIASGPAYAQSDDQSSESQVAAARSALPSSEEAPRKSEERRRAWLARCLQDWDAGTHMTKKDWERTCRRLALERTKFVTKFLMQQPK